MAQGVVGQLRPAGIAAACLTPGNRWPLADILQAEASWLPSAYDVCAECLVCALQADGAVPAKRHSSGEPAAPAAPCPAASAEQLALQQLLMAGPATLLQAQAAGLGGVLPGSYAGFIGFPGYVGVDTLLSGQAWASLWH